MASATSEPASVKTQESGAFGSKRDVNNYYVTNINLLDGQI